MKQVEIKPNRRLTLDFSSGLSREACISKLVYAVDAESPSEKYLTDIAIMRIMELATYCCTVAKLEDLLSSGDLLVNRNVIWLKPLTEMSVVPIPSPEPKNWNHEQVIKACEDLEFEDEDLED